MDVTVAGGAGLDTSIDNEDDEGQDATTNMISELVSQGAELNATLEKTGETSLHLAARYARADAAKRLLDMGADVNFQDNTGRTPLHAAVAADAMGAFQVSHFVFYNEKQFFITVESVFSFDSLMATSIFVDLCVNFIFTCVDLTEKPFDKFKRKNARWHNTVDSSC